MSLKFSISMAVAVASLSLVGVVHAQVFTETTDAGQTLPTADATAVGVAGTSLTTILGSFNAGTDADLYVIDITNPSTFSATTDNAVTTTAGLDTAIFLFNASGQAIATNDDASGGATVTSTLPAGNALYASLPAGTYYLGISVSGNEPLNTANQLLFLPYPEGDTTAIRGAASGVNPTTEANFNGNEFTSQTGNYEIDLTSTETASNPAGVPEPSAWAALALASTAVGYTVLRRRTA